MSGRVSSSRRVRFAQSAGGGDHGAENLFMPGRPARRLQGKEDLNVYHARRSRSYFLHRAWFGAADSLAVGETTMALTNADRDEMAWMLSQLGPNGQAMMAAVVVAQGDASRGLPTSAASTEFVRLFEPVNLVGMKAYVIRWGYLLADGRIGSRTLVGLPSSQN